VWFSGVRVEHGVVGRSQHRVRPAATTTAAAAGQSGQGQVARTPQGRCFPVADAARRATLGHFSARHAAKERLEGRQGLHLQGGERRGRRRHHAGHGGALRRRPQGPSPLSQ